jgi:hypothetical protein
MGSQAVYACLAQCLAADPGVQRPAEAQLQQWEGQPGYCTALAVRPSALVHSSLPARCAPACSALAPPRSRRAPRTRRAQEIVGARAGVDPSVRFLATVSLKNAVNRHWRPRRDASTCVRGPRARVRVRVRVLRTPGVRVRVRAL